MEDYKNKSYEELDSLRTAWIAQYQIVITPILDKVIDAFGREMQLCGRHAVEMVDAGKITGNNDILILRSPVIGWNGAQAGHHYQVFLNAAAEEWQPNYYKNLDYKHMVMNYMDCEDPRKEHENELMFITPGEWMQKLKSLLPAAIEVVNNKNVKIHSSMAADLYKKMSLEIAAEVQI